MSISTIVKTLCCMNLTKDLNLILKFCWLLILSLRRGCQILWGTAQGGPTLKAKIRFSSIRLFFICPFSIGHCEQNSSFQILEILLFYFIFLVWICHCKLSSLGPSQCMQIRCVASNYNFNDIKCFVSLDISHNDCSVMYANIEIIIFGQVIVVHEYLMCFDLDKWFWQRSHNIKPILRGSLDCL